MRPAPHWAYLFRQTATRFLGQLSELRPRSLKRQPCSHAAILAGGMVCQCSLSGIRIYHSLARPALLAPSVSIMTQYWKPVEHSLPCKMPGALKRNAGGLSCSRSNLAHKWHCLLAVSPVTSQWWNNPLIPCYLSGRSWVLTEAPNPLWLAKHNLSWVVVEQGRIHWAWRRHNLSFCTSANMSKVHLTIHASQLYSIVI